MNEPRVPRGSRFWQQALARSVRYTVERARREVFGSPDPPFRRYDDVLDWLWKQEDSHGRYNNAFDWLKRRNPGDEEASALTEVQRRVQDFPFPVTVTLPALDVPMRRGESPLRLVALRGDLARLVPFVRQVADQTGWTEGEAFWNLLTGAVPPATPRATWKGTLFGLPHATVTLWPWNLSLFQFEQIGRKLRKSLTAIPWIRVEQVADDGKTIGVSHRNPWRLPAKEPTDWDHLLLDLITKEGRIPKTRGEWERLIPAWKAQTNREVSWHALRTRWRRVRKEHPEIAATLKTIWTEEEAGE